MLRKNAIDITGKTFGDLTTIKPIKNGNGRGVKWLCICICGKESVAFCGHLRAGKRVSCGCRSDKYIYRTGVNRVYSNYKRKAKLRKINFLLNKEDFEVLIKGNCNYCGIGPKQKLKRLKTNKLQLLYNGIDRIDSSGDYFKDNCVSCCRYCNQSKSDLSLKEWIIHLKRIIKWRKIDF